MEGRRMDLMRRLRLRLIGHPIRRERPMLRPNGGPTGPYFKAAIMQLGIESKSGINYGQMREVIHQLYLKSRKQLTDKREELFTLEENTEFKRLLMNKGSSVVKPNRTSIDMFTYFIHQKKDDSTYSLEPLNPKKSWHQYFIKWANIPISRKCKIQKEQYIHGIVGTMETNQINLFCTRRYFIIFWTFNDSKRKSVLNNDAPMKHSKLPFLKARIKLFMRNTKKMLVKELILEIKTKTEFYNINNVNFFELRGMLICSILDELQSVRNRGIKKIPLYFDEQETILENELDFSMPDIVKKFEYEKKGINCFELNNRHSNQEKYSKIS